MIKKIIRINKILINKFGYPERNKTNVNPLDLLVATILSQNTNDRNSYRAFKNLKKNYPDYSMIKNAPVENIKSVIKIAGLANQKAATIKNLITNLPTNKSAPTLNFIKKMENKEALSYLTNFKGVGIKTASCVLLFSLGRNICPVDTHVNRTLNRIGLVKTKNPVKTFEVLNKNFPEGIAHSFHTNLIRLGREFCLPSSPKCIACPLKNICKYPHKNFKKTNKMPQKSFLLLENV